MEIRQSVRGMKYLLCCVVLVGSLLSATAQAATYYLAPTGSNTSAGTSASAPWKTFAHAIPKLNPGDTLLLMDGVYTQANAGNLRIDCASNAKSGTAAQRITVKAEHERQAWIKGDGSTSEVALVIVDCQWWQIEGLRVSGADGPPGTMPLYGNDLERVTFSRLLVHHSNRQENQHLLSCERCNNNLFEENEFYYFHRHALVLHDSTGNTFRRNYAHSRSYDDIPGGRESHHPDRGDDAFSLYPANDTTVENNIAEDIDRSFVVIASHAGYGRRNRFFGNIGIGTGPFSGWQFGLVARAGSPADAFMPQDNEFHHNLALNVGATAEFSFDAFKGTISRNNTMYAPSKGVSLLNGQFTDGDRRFSYESTNDLIVHSRSYGFHLTPNPPATITFTVRNPLLFGNQGNSAPPTTDARITGEVLADPQLGTCRVFIPDGSPAKEAGIGGADIGANVLYRYENGVLTNQPLWNPLTGTFPCGAIVPGVKDVAGASCFDVHTRLNVQANGCTLPAGYGQQVISPPRICVSSPPHSC
jgi:hypothetical protein